MKVYGSMDRIVQVNENYTAGLSMYSSRIYNYELVIQKINMAGTQVLVSYIFIMMI